jgi:P-type Ca2+ transporter type 2C
VITLLVSTAFGMFVLITLAVIFDTPLPLLPVQILWLNLVANGIQDVGLAFEPSEGDELERPPRRPTEPIFDSLMVQRVLVGATYMGVSGFLLFTTLLELGWSLDAARNSVLLLLVLQSNVQTGASRSERRFALGISPLRNPLLLGGVIVALLVHVAALYLPGISDVLRTQPVTMEHAALLVVIAIGLFVVMEGHKLLRRLYRRGR